MIGIRGIETMRHIWPYFILIGDDTDTVVPLYWQQPEEFLAIVFLRQRKRTALIERIAQGKIGRDPGCHRRSADAAPLLPPAETDIGIVLDSGRRRAGQEIVERIHAGLRTALWPGRRRQGQKHKNGYIPFHLIIFFYRTRLIQPVTGLLPSFRSIR